MTAQGASKSDEPGEAVVSSKSALDDYYDDILGSIVDDPLKKLEEAEKLKFSCTQTNNIIHTKNKVDVDASVEKMTHYSAGVNELSSTYFNSVKVKLQPKTNTTKRQETDFAEPKQKPVSSLIIPAAFPKLAPASIKVSSKVKPKLASNLKVKKKTKLDSKAALVLLEERKSKLTTKQRLRLEAKLKQKEQSKQKIKVEEEVKLESSTTTIEKTDLLSAQQVAVDEATGLVRAKAIIQPGRPEWGNSRFECLLFSVAGLKLAVPLASLGAIYKIENELTPLVGRADWFMGLYRHLERNVNVIDTAKLVMPDRWHDKVQDNYQFIIRLGGNNWGMACDSVHESIQLMPDEVKWRTERSRRAWLSGTVIDHMCALLDVEVLGDMLHQETGMKPSQFSK